MKRYIIEAEDDIYDYDNYDEFDKEYDRLFGEPTTEVFEVNDFFRYMDALISYAEHSVFATEDSSKSEESNQFIIEDIITTATFESALKSQVKDHKTKTLEQILKAVKMLLNYEVKTQFDNHWVSENLKGHKDIHIEGGNLILIYQYVSPTKLRIDAKLHKDTGDVLKLQDLVDHTELHNYDKSKFKSPQRHLTFDKLKKKMKLK